jgi:hypothetical protein
VEVGDGEETDGEIHNMQPRKYLLYNVLNLGLVNMCMLSQFRMNGVFCMVFVCSNLSGRGGGTTGPTVVHSLKCHRTLA